MSSASPRLLFVFVLVIHSLLWSQSRYAQLPESSLLRGEQSLVKRFASELLNPDAPVFDTFEKQASPRFHLELL